MAEPFDKEHVEKDIIEQPKEPTGIKIEIEDATKFLNALLQNHLQKEESKVISQFQHLVYPPVGDLIKDHDLLRKARGKVVQKLYKALDDFKVRTDLFYSEDIKSSNGRRYAWAWMNSDPEFKKVLDKYTWLIPLLKCIDRATVDPAPYPYDQIDGGLKHDRTTAKGDVEEDCFSCFLANDDFYKKAAKATKLSIHSIRLALTELVRVGVLQFLRKPKGNVRVYADGYYLERGTWEKPKKVPFMKKGLLEQLRTFNPFHGPTAS